MQGSCNTYKFASPTNASIFVFVCLRRSAGWLVQRASAVCPMFYIEGLETTVACVF